MPRARARIAATDEGQSRSTCPTEKGNQELVDAAGSVRLHPVRRFRDPLHAHARHPARIRFRKLGPLGTDHEASAPSISRRTS